MTTKIVDKILPTTMVGSFFGTAGIDEFVLDMHSPKARRSCARTSAADNPALLTPPPQERL